MTDAATKERARIVAWLRTQARECGQRCEETDLAFPHSRIKFGYASYYADKFATLLEQGCDASSARETLLSGWPPA